MSLISAPHILRFFYQHRHYYRYMKNFRQNSNTVSGYTKSGLTGRNRQMRFRRKNHPEENPIQFPTKQEETDLGRRRNDH